MNGPVIAVVVPTYRRPQLLHRCLVALCAQNVDKDLYEIIVADDGPDDGTALIVSAIANQPGGPGIRYVPVVDTQGPAGARNRGWRSAHTPLIAFTDDDTIPDCGWLRAGLEALASGADAAVGRTVVPTPDPPTDYERDIAGLQKAEFITANCFVTRRALEAVGGFDERYQLAWREDSDLQFALMESGHRIVAAPEATITHPVRPAPWGVSVRLQRKVMYDALLYRKYPRQYRQRIRPVPPLDYYAIVVALLAMPVGLFIGRIGMTYAGLAIWLVLTAAFCQRRLKGASRSWSHVAEMVVTSTLIPPLALFWRAVGGLRYRVMFF
ncbi:glycosyltransferase family 2 protein [Uliginosibacterium sp. sgz301328]|uniref:glycosyltransferase family 2 protein n=1 Tax=Uliginosibacterium sp. sgz301328 TaxID=3243764 RepID=UPI00359D5B72